MQNVEIDKQTDASTAELDVRKQLSFVNRRDRLDRFHFDNDLRLNEKIDPIADFQLHAIEDDGKSDLAVDSQPSLAQQMGKASLVSTLEQSRPQFGVQIHRSI